MARYGCSEIVASIASFRDNTEMLMRGTWNLRPVRGQGGNAATPWAKRQLY
jgi:hypothetical protein